MASFYFLKTGSLSERIDVMDIELVVFLKKIITF